MPTNDSDLFIFQLGAVCVAACIVGLLEIARARRLGRFDAMADAFTTARGWLGTVRRTTPAPASVQAGGVPVQPFDSEGRAVPAAWRILLNDAPDIAAHLLIIGPTGSGKTTFTRAVLAGRAGWVLIITPKPDDDWGAPVVTIDDDGTLGTAEAAFASVATELRRRLAASKRQQLTDQPLTIVCDDYPVLASECPSAAGVFKLVGRLGRSLRVRLIVLSQSERVKSLGLDGEGDAVANFMTVRLTRQHEATVDTGVNTLRLDTSEVRDTARRASIAGRLWQPLGVDGFPTRADGPDRRTDGQTSAPIGADLAPIAPSVCPGDKPALVAQLVAWGWSTSQIREALKGDNAAIGSLVKAARGDLD